MTNQIIIGLGYRARAGKDTVGQYLVEKYGFTRISFADTLKRVVQEMTGQDSFDPEFKSQATICGWTGGQALQQIGVHMRALRENIWVEASGLANGAKFLRRIVVTDVRFKNEAEHVRELGGELWRIDRPGLPADPHISEQEGALIQWDMHIKNDKSVEAMLQRVDELVQMHPNFPTDQITVDMKALL